MRSLGRNRTPHRVEECIAHVCLRFPERRHGSGEGIVVGSAAIFVAFGLLDTPSRWSQSGRPRLTLYHKCRLSSLSPSPGLWVLPVVLSTAARMDVGNDACHGCRAARRFPFSYVDRKFKGGAVPSSPERPPVAG